MKLPNWENAVVAKSKIVDYLLSFAHEEGHPKAAFFSRFGFQADEWEKLADALIRHARANDVGSYVSSKYGMRYIVIGELETPDGRRPLVKVIWAVNMDSDRPRLITAYPEK